MRNSEYSMDKHTVIARLQEAGIAPTKQRIEIGQLLFARPQHVSADQVMAMVSEHGSRSVSKATVYNTLNLFAQKGIVREVIVDPSRVYYDSNTGEHHHFFNVDTGELTDMAPGSFAIHELPQTPEGTVAAGVDIIIRVRSV